MNATDHNPWKTLSSKQVYDNDWISVSHQEVLNPAGGQGIYGTVHFKNVAVGILPLDENLNTWLVGQYRYPLASYSWEIPEGGGARDVDPLVSAQRELQEETGLVANRWTPLMQSHLSNSVSDEHAFVFVAQDLTLGESTPEDTEELVIKKLPFNQVVEMVMEGKITDSLAMLAVMKVQLLLDRGELRI